MDLVIDLAGAWAGTATHDGDTTDVAIELESAAGGILIARLTLPVVHLERMIVARAVPQVVGPDIRLGMLTLRYDPAAGTLTGDLPEALVPVYQVPFTLRRAANIDRLLAAGHRSEMTAPVVAPSWTFDAGAPCWPGTTFSNGLVLAGCDDGKMHAIDARTGKERWTFRAGGSIRTRATTSGNAVYFQADNGAVYALRAADGSEIWRLQDVPAPITRLPFDNPKSRYDRFGSDVTISADRLYLGTHDGRVVALNAARGTKLWEFRTGDSVTAAPAVAGGSVYAGSFDKFVYSLDAATGALVWKRDTQGAVVSTPALDGKRLVIGNRAYDLLGLDAGTGNVAWKRYIWFSWVESSATMRDEVAYVGSSDATAAYAFDARTGRPIWTADVRGWAWGQPAVSDDRVYVGVSSQAGYAAEHHGGIIALDRKNGRPVWRFMAAPAKSGPYGFPGSGALGPGRVFFAGLDGNVYAFAR